MEKEKEVASFRYILVMYFLLFAIFVPLFLILRPRIIRNIAESGIRERAELYREYGKEKKEKYTVALLSGDSLVYCERSLAFSSSLPHSLIEALLLPLSEEEKERGLSSAISGKTRLLGVSEENGFFFVSLSPDFLDSENIGAAYDEIKKTLESLYFVESLTLICGNRIIRL